MLMSLDKSNHQQVSNFSNQLIPLPAFKKSGRCPLEPYHLLFHHKQSLVDSGAFVRFGKRWLVDEEKFFEWLRAHGDKGSHHSK